MFSDIAFDILKELQRNPDTIPVFNDKGIRIVLEEIKAIFESNCEQAAVYSLTGDKTMWPLLNFRHTALQRNKRCLLAYFNERLKRIKTLRWEFGSAIPLDVRSALCDPEIAFFNAYSKSLTSYMRSIGNYQGLDLTGDINPPKTLYVEVRCVNDYGKLELKNGEVIYLKKNSQHYLPRYQIETLIRQGILKHMASGN